jgi:hypothetical protein
MNIYASTSSGGVWDDWHNRATITFDGGVTDYTLTVTDFFSGQLDRVYAGTTDPASAYLLTAPIRQIVEAGINDFVQRVGPSAPGAGQDFDTNIASFAAARFRGVAGGDANPYIRFENVPAATAWDLLFPGTGGTLPGGLVLQNANGGNQPLRIDPAAPHLAWQITAAGNQMEIHPTLYTTDFAPNARNDDQFYFAFVSGVPIMDSSNLNGFPSVAGSVIGRTESLSTYGYSFQIFKDTAGSFWIRNAASATTWRAWVDLTASASLPSVGTPGTYGDATHVARVTTDAQGRVSASSSVAIVPTAQTTTVAGLASLSVTGSIYYCSDAKSILSDGVAAGSAPVTGGGGTLVGLVNGAWRILC